MKSICGIDCSTCEICNTCKGCFATNGQPFGEKCMVAAYCQKGQTALDEFKQKLIAAFNALSIPDMAKVTDLCPLRGSFINIEYPLPSGKMVKLWDDNKIYLGSQLHKEGCDRCYGIAGDETYLMVAEYGALGTDAELVVFMRWN